LFRVAIGSHRFDHPPVAGRRGIRELQYADPLAMKPFTQQEFA
jgi:hypothetical protein